MGYRANRGDNDYGDDGNIEEPKQSFGSKVSSAASSLNGLRKDIKENGGLGGLAKNAIENKINDKKDQIKNNAKEKLGNKKDQIKNSVSSKLPPSVKQKQDAIKGKAEAVKKKLNAPKDKMNAVKGKVDDAKKKINVNAFKKGVKAAVNAAAPGAGVAAEKMLETPLGESAVDAARNASNPVSAIKEGTKKLLEIVVKKETVKKIAITLIPSLLIFLVVIIIVLSILSKFHNSQTYAHGDAYGSEEKNEVDEKYTAFYNNVEKYGVSNRAMVISVLTSYQDNDEYTNEDDNTGDDSAITCTEEELENGDCVAEIVNGITIYSKRKMKKYIKKVNDAINNSNGDVTEGDYNDPENTGSSFFKWLYNDFIADYYSDYVSNDNTKKKKEIIRFIYLYYNDIKEGIPSGIVGISSASCPKGITVTGDNQGTYDLEEYVAGVVLGENNYSKDGNIEAMKAQAIAVRTYALNYTQMCTKPIPNNTTAQVYRTPTPGKNDSDNSIKAAQETAGQVLTYNGKVFSSQYDHFKRDDCSGGSCFGTYTLIPGTDTHKVTIPESYLKPPAEGGFGDYGGHGNGMSQVAANYMQDQGNLYDQILKFFYSTDVTISKMGLGVSGGIPLGNNGIYSTSIFPINTELSNLVLTQGYRYDGGDAHGAIDLFCNQSVAAASGDVRTFCTSIPIVASHSGVVESVVRNQHCASSEYSNDDKTLSSSSSCGGNGIKIRITDSSDSYYNYSFEYWHFDSVSDDIQVGQTVQAGQFLGFMGSTGKSTGWHLHFAIKNASGDKINQNSNILQFCSTNGLANDGIRPTNEGPKG